LQDCGLQSDQGAVSYFQYQVTYPYLCHSTDFCNDDDSKFYTDTEEPSIVFLLCLMIIELYLRPLLFCGILFLVIGNMALTLNMGVFTDTLMRHTALALNQE
jgi:hypothetical protein